MGTGETTFSQFATVDKLTEATALSRAVDAGPPKLIVAIEGRPEEAADDAAKFIPETMSETNPWLGEN